MSKATGQGNATTYRRTGRGRVEGGAPEGDALSQQLFKTGPAPSVIANLDEVQEAMGRRFSKTDLAKAIGAPNGAEIEVIVDGPNSIYIMASHPYIDRLQRNLTRDEETGKLVMHNEEFYAAAGAPKGLGTRMLAKQVKNLRSLGVSEIRTEAAGHGKDSGFMGVSKENGFYTWARLGYDGPLPKYGAKRPSNLAKAKTVRELMSLPGGRDWWKTHGSKFEGSFDLGKNSTSVRILEAYAEERGIRV